jgi:ribosomal protein S18 acetylase RimI-like enzyme
MSKVSSTVEIRSPTLAESQRVVSLRNESLRGVDSAYEKLAQNPIRHWLAQHVALPTYFHWLNEGWILVDGGEITGWLYLLHRAKSTHINDLGIAAGQRRRGYGRRLLAWAEQRARDRRKAALTLAVTGTNQPAVALYETAGYLPVHHRRWKGAGNRLPLVKAQMRVRELDLSQRPATFGDMWQRSLKADQHPVAPLIEDQIGNWYASGGRPGNSGRTSGWRAMRTWCNKRCGCSWLSLTTANCCRRGGAR